MSNDGIRIRLDHDTGRLTIDAPADATEDQMIEAGKRAYRHARRRLRPNVRERAQDIGLLAFNMRGRGATWEQVTRAIEKLKGREPGTMDPADIRKRYGNRVRYEDPADVARPRPVARGPAAAIEDERRGTSG